MTVPESTRTILFALCIFGLWAPFPVWFAGALTFVIHMGAVPPSGLKRAAVGLLIAAMLMLLLFIATMLAVLFISLGGSIIVTSLMVPIMVILLVAFVIVADQAYLAAHPPSEIRQFRGVHLGLNLAGMFIFPIFTYIGIPISLGKLRKYRSSNSTAYKWALGTGIVTLLILTITILLAIISASISTYRYDDFSRCRKRSVLQAEPTTTTALSPTMSIVNETTTSFAAGSTTSSIDPTTTDFTTFVQATTDSFATSGSNLPDPTFVEPTTAWTMTEWWETTTPLTWPTNQETTAACWAGSGSSGLFSVGGTRWPSYNGGTLLNEPGVVIAVVVLSLIAFAFHIAFTAVADQIILNEIGPTGGNQITGVVVSQAPGAPVLVHPCASCGTQMQFTRTGPTTQVQCFQCRAIVEFTTA